MLASGMDLSADVLKIGHHGSHTSTSDAFLDAVSPTYAVISCETGNSYGHPHAETLNKLRAAGVQLFRTDDQGTITVTSDGSTLTWNTSPSDDWVSGSGTVSYTHLLLNIHEEHLDHYGTMEKYIHAKQQIYLHQLPQDLLFCGMDVTPADGTCRSRIFTVSDQNFDADVLLGGTKIHFDGHSYQIPSDRIPLLGHHNHLSLIHI